MVLLVLAAASWFAKSPFESVLNAKQRKANLERFLGELKPRPVQESGDWGDAVPWAKSLLVPVPAGTPGAVRPSSTSGKGLEAVVRTFMLATAAISLASLAALLLVPLAARNLATHEPIDLAYPPRRWSAPLWAVARGLTRALFVFTRSMPEFLLGFVLIAAFGPEGAIWAMVLALAVHNFGILGRLGAEVTENAPPSPARAIIAHGGGRFAAYVGGILPDAFNRLVVYFFYRWETCVREATVLGMLSVMSLGLLIEEAKTAFKFDRMVFYVLLGALIVIAGDIVSALVRRWLRFERP